MRRRQLIAGFGTMMALPFAARGQQAATVQKVGFLYPGPRAVARPRIDAFTEGLRDGGYRVPEQVELVSEFAEGDPARLSPLARALVDRNVAVIAAVSTGAANATLAAKSTIPIVALDLETDPVATGMIASPSHPGGNLTGLFFDFPQFRTKLLELLKEAVPKLSKVAVVWDPNVGPAQLESIGAGEAAMNLTMEKFAARNIGEINEAFDRASRADADGLVVLSSPFFGANTKLMAELALKHALPAITVLSEFARDGGLISYGPNIFDIYRRVGTIAAKLLQGQKPADLPVELPTKFELVINLKTAKILKLAIPPTLLVSADEVIE
jgi:putative tryptophan/tyrosine transport system substrate-binding protein